MTAAELRRLAVGALVVGCLLVDPRMPVPLVAGVLIADLCVFAVAGGLSAEFGADTPAPDTVDDALAADLVTSGGAS